jgi:hypothetical protein
VDSGLHAPQPVDGSNFTEACWQYPCSLCVIFFYQKIEIKLHIFAQKPTLHFEFQESHAHPICATDSVPIFTIFFWKLGFNLGTVDGKKEGIHFFLCFFFHSCILIVFLLT